MSESIVSNLRPIDRRKLDYSVCIQFLFMHLACLAAIWTGVSVIAVVTCLALYVVRMFAITAGFHRFFSHRTYKTGRVFGFLMALPELQLTRKVRSGGRLTIAATICTPTLKTICIRR